MILGSEAGAFVPLHCQECQCHRLRQHRQALHCIAARGAPPPPLLAEELVAAPRDDRVAARQREGAGVGLDADGPGLARERAQAAAVAGRGGVAIAIAREIGIAPLFLGTGEQLADFELFDAPKFLERLV